MESIDVMDNFVPNKSHTIDVMYPMGRMDSYLYQRMAAVTNPAGPIFRCPISAIKPVTLSIKLQVCIHFLFVCIKFSMISE